MKSHTKKRRKTPLTHAKIQRSLAFGAIFGLVMLMIGLSQLFAQSTVAFYLNPYYQTANANEDRSLTVSLSNNGQQVDGGTVKITYNSAQLSYVAFNDPVSTQVGITNRTNSPGIYSYDFQIYNGSQNLPSLGTLVLKAKPSGSQQNAFIDFDTSVTRAYFISGNSRSYYPSAHGRAAIIINAAPATQPPAQPPAATNTSPAPSQAPVASRPTAQNNIASNNPAANTAQTPPPTQVRGPQDPGPSGQNIDPSFSASQSDGYVPPPKPKRIAPIVFIVIGVVCMAAAGGMYIYLKYIRDMPLAMGFGRSLHRGLFDEVPDNADDESIVITPAASTVKNDEPDQEPKIEAKPAHPSIIKKSKERAMRRRAAEESKKKLLPNHEAAATQPERPAPKHQEESHPPEHHVSRNAHKPEHHHQESETVTVALHPHPGAAPAVAINTPPSPLPPKPPSPPAPIAATVPAKPQPVAAPPPNPPPLMPVLPVAAQPVKEVKKPIADQGHHVPDWQTKLKVPGATPSGEEEPPDMFELAHDHPESFGSSQLYEVETKENEDHDKAKK